MKKVLLSLSVLALSNWANAQTGNVGINTENPTETLNVNGTLRINELPVVNGKIRTTPTGTASATKDQNFTPTKMVVVDNNGVVGKADIPSSGAIYQGSTSISLETNNSFQRAALTGDATAAKNSNATKVVAIQNKPVAETAPTDNQVLQWNGTQWAPANLPAQTTYTGSASVALEGNAFQRQALTGDATAAKNSNATKVVAIQNKPVSATAPQNNQVLQWNGTQWAPANLPAQTTYAGSASVALEGNAFQRQALTGDATAAKNSNATKVIAIQNKPVAETAPTDNQVLQWKNNAWTPATLDIPTLPKDPQLGTGTVIAIGGKVQIAEEITATMSNNDVTISSSGNPKEIPHLTTIVVNNKNLFKPTTSGNSFQVSQEGTYQIMMNVSISTTPTNSLPVIGVWNNSTNKWIARIANNYVSPSNVATHSQRQTYTLITTVDLQPGINYSFRVTNTSNLVVHGYNGGTTGSGPATFISVKQLK